VLVGLQNAHDLRYREWDARRMEQALALPRGSKRAKGTDGSVGLQMGMSKKRLEQMRHLLQANQQALQEQLRQYAGQRIAET